MALQRLVATAVKHLLAAMLSGKRGGRRTGSATGTGSGTGTGTGTVAPSWLPDFVDPVVKEVELAPYLQPENSDVTLLELSALLNDKNATMACVRQAVGFNYTSRDAVAVAVADHAQANAQHTTAATLDDTCARLFALSAKVLLQNATNTSDIESLYSMPSKVFIMSATVFVSFITVFGNAIVLASFVIERSLRQATNYFIASLAVTDLLIGLFSMNFFSLYLVLDNHWLLGDIICDLWLALDFTVCLASQYTVFFITVDRFCSVRLPAKYRNWRTDQKVLWMVLGCWILPTAVFFPIILGWPFFNQRKRLEHQCEAEFIWDPWLTLWLTVGYYWITLIAMTSLYVVIYRVAVQMSKKADANRKRVSAVFQLAEKSVVRLQVCMTQNLNVADGHGKQEVNKSFSLNSAPRFSNSASRSSRCDSLFEDSDNEITITQDDNNVDRDRSALCRSLREAACQQATLVGVTRASADLTANRSNSNNLNASFGNSIREKKTRFSGETSDSKRSVSRQMSHEHEHEHEHDFDGDRDSGTIMSPTDARREFKLQSSIKASRFQALAKRVSGAKKKSAGQQTQKAENRAKKALRTITFILGCFVACWTPYHVVILIESFAKLWFGEPIVNAHVYNFSYWLCYLNSPINPFCYAFVNVQFKKTFLRILKCDWSIK